MTSRIVSQALHIPSRRVCPAKNSNINRQDKGSNTISVLPKISVEVYEGLKYKLLIGDNLYGMGKQISVVLEQLGFEGICCGNSYSSLWENLGKEEFAGVLFFGTLDTDEMHDFVRNCREGFPGINIYAILFSRNQTLHQTLMEEGVKRCLSLPMVSYEICDEIVYDFYSGDDLQIIPKIGAFLTKNGFPSIYAGFKYLCFAIEMTVDDPSVLHNITINLYTRIGEKLDISSSQVDRGLRILRDAAERKGIFEFFENGKKKLTNKKMIAALSRDFAEFIGFSTDRFKGYVD